MTLHPKVPADIALAPVAAAIDLNLRGLRDRDPSAIRSELQLQLDRPALPNTRENRGGEVLSVALETSIFTAGKPPSARTRPAYTLPVVL
jgi:hypothetical protein